MWRDESTDWLTSPFILNLEMGNQLGSQPLPFEYGRRPTDSELLLLHGLQKQLFTRLVQSPTHIGLLERYWQAMVVDVFQRQHPSCELPTFVLSSPLWRTYGGFTTDRPSYDLRLTGELGLRCIVHFVEQFPGESLLMKRKRGGYPFVHGAMAVARVMAEALCLVDSDGQPGAFGATETVYWHLVRADQDIFLQLFAVAFMLFEREYCAQMSKEHVDTSCSKERVRLLAGNVKVQMVAALEQCPRQIDDLHSVCSNAKHALEILGSMEFETNQASHGKISGRSNWHKKSDATSQKERVAKRLFPRSPEVVTGEVEAGRSPYAFWSNHSSSHDIFEDAIDIFEGLEVKKYLTSNVKEGQEEVGMNLDM